MKPIVIKHRGPEDGRPRVTIVDAGAVVAVDLWPISQTTRSPKLPIEHPRMDVHFAASSLIFWEVEIGDARDLFVALGWEEQYVEARGPLA